MGSVSMDCVTSIDCLSDDLLIKILSFLPTKQVASTSLLSKRWRTLFALCHNLDIDDSIFWNPKEDKPSRLDLRKSFNDFMDSSLALQEGRHIKTFSLKLTERYENLCTISSLRCVDRWICNVLKHGVSELHLHVKSMYKPIFPSKILTSTTLVKLSLRKLHIVSFPLNTSLLALKVLLLDSILIETDQLSDVFLAGCPALEDLTIHNMYYTGSLSCVISSKTVKKLAVSNTYEFFVISLNTPNVVDLYYSDYARRRYLHCNMDSLAKATLDLHSPEYDLKYAAAMTDLISGIRNVKTLHLTPSTVEVCCKCELPVLNNLTNLVFSIKRQGWTVFLPLLLERSPNLKTMVFLGMEHYRFRGHRFVGIQIPPNNQIKILSIMQYQGSENELKHIGHFLLNMKCLEVVKIYLLSSAMDDPKKVQLKEDLLKLPAASSRLKIQVI